MTAFREIAEDLFCAVTTQGADRRFNYLIRRKSGNVLVHGVDSKGIKALNAGLSELGGVKYQLLCHWHEAKHAALGWYRQWPVEVYAPEVELPLIKKMLGDAATLQPTLHRKRLWREVVPCLVSGHTQGYTVYKWRDFLFGGDFINRRAETGWVSYFAGPHVQAGLEGYRRLRDLEVQRWLPLKSRELSDPPFEFGNVAIDEAESKIRKKWKVAAR